MEIRKMRLDQLNPAYYNPRKSLQPGDPAYEKLKKSIQEFGLVDPLIWNKRTGRLVGGHQRLKVLRDLGYTEAEVSVVDLPEDKEKALNLALNKIGGEWDMPRLKDLLEELDTGAWDIEITGFDEKEIEKLMCQFPPVETEEEKQARRDLFFGYLAQFESWAEWIYTAPVSVWDGNDPRWLARKRQLMQKFFPLAGASRMNVVDSRFGSLWARGKRMQSAGGRARYGRHKGGESLGPYASIFDPVLAEVILKAYSPGPGSRVYDPFGGDETRVIMAAGHGYELAAVEIRPEQVEATEKQLEYLGLGGKVKWIVGDSTQPVDLPDAWADLVFTCPPYYDLEVYSDDPADLSNAPSYGEFLEGYGRAIRQAARILKSPGFAVFVVGNFRDKRGDIVDFRGDTRRLFLEVGLEFHDEIIYRQPLGTAPSRGYPFRASRRCIRNHEYVLVFRKGRLDDFPGKRA